MPHGARKQLARSAPSLEKPDTGGMNRAGPETVDHTENRVL